MSWHANTANAATAGTATRVAVSRRGCMYRGWWGACYGGMKRVATLARCPDEGTEATRREGTKSRALKASVASNANDKIFASNEKLPGLGGKSMRFTSSLSEMGALV